MREIKTATCERCGRELELEPRNAYHGPEWIAPFQVIGRACKDSDGNVHRGHLPTNVKVQKGGRKLALPDIAADAIVKDAAIQKDGSK